MDSEFERLLADGVYKQSPQFVQNEDNLHRIITYLQKVSPRPPVFDILLGLLKFFRFPLALCCQHLYHKLKNTPTQIEACKERVCEVAAYVRSLAGEMGVGGLAEIQFFQQWGHVKKKFKVSITPQEQEFSQCIMNMSHTKQQLKGSQCTEQIERIINDFMSTSFKNANVFEEKSIELMKASASEIIDAVFARKQEEKEIRRNRDVHSTEHRVQQPMAVQKREIVADRPKRSESIPVQHESAVISQVVAVPVWEGEKGICCRTSFVKDEVIDQPECLRIQYKYYRFPFHSRPGEIPSKCDKIKRTLCGFLNAEGGTIYFGIKELTDSRKRYINGLYLSESVKKDFGMEITRLMKEVLPDVGKKCTVKYVPVKDKQDKYISGLYIVKVIVERGAKDQVYSYIQVSNSGVSNQRFAFKTENEVLEISEIQRVLKIFKNKVQSPSRDYYPVHPHPCPEPQIGKPLYKLNDNYEDDYDDYDYNNDYREQRNSRVDKYDYKSEKIDYRQKDYSYSNIKQERERRGEQSDEDREYHFPSLLKNRGEQPQNWAQQQEQKLNTKYQSKNKRFKQKDTNHYLLHTRQSDLKALLERERIEYDLITQVRDYHAWTFLTLKNPEDKIKIITFPGQVLEVYSRISCKSLSNDQVGIMEEIIVEYRNKWGTISKEQDDGDIKVFNTELNAVVFYLKMQEMGLKVEFTPLA